MMCHSSHYWQRRDRWAESRFEPVEHERIVDPAPTETTRDPDLLVSQAERDDVAAQLARHFADGRLTVEEYEERVEAALASRTGHDLAPLLADLPATRPPAATSPPTEHRRRRGSAWSSARVIALTAVVVLAIATGPWALWLLWPAFVFTGACGARRRVHYAGRHTHHLEPADQRPPVTQRL